jgi:hypothetical protein
MIYLGDGNVVNLGVGEIGVLVMVALVGLRGTTVDAGVRFRDLFLWFRVSRDQRGRRE